MISSAPPSTSGFTRSVNSQEALAAIFVDWFEFCKRRNGILNFKDEELEGIITGDKCIKSKVHPRVA